MQDGKGARRSPQLTSAQKELDDAQAALKASKANQAAATATYERLAKGSK